jgi:WD40 repeat protein
VRYNVHEQGDYLVKVKAGGNLTYHTHFRCWSLGGHRAYIQNNYSYLFYVFHKKETAVMVGIWSDRKDTYVEGQYVCLHWHPRFPLLAGALSDGTVEIFNDNAQRLEFVNIKESSPSRFVMWHPTKKVLATAWANGNVATWTDQERTLREGKMHRSAVCFMKWNPTGTRLVTGDEVVTLCKCLVNVLSQTIGWKSCGMES